MAAWSRGIVSACGVMSREIEPAMIYVGWYLLKKEVYLAKQQLDILL
jgi:hypothetical protein